MSPKAFKPLTVSAFEAKVFLLSNFDLLLKKSLLMKFTTQLIVNHKKN